MAGSASRTSASTIVWERATGKPLAPGIGWQDLRTVGTCLVLQSEGIRLAPNASATKVMAILDEVDPERSRAVEGELCFGTVDSWVAWTLSGGAAAGTDTLHVTDATNAAVTALVDPSIVWDNHCSSGFGSPWPCSRPSSTLGARRRGHALPGAPTICGIAGDQKASLVGQGCTLPRPGQAHLRHRGGRSISAPERMTRPSLRGKAQTARFLSWRSASAERPPGVPKRSCSRRAPRSSGSETISGSPPRHGVRRGRRAIHKLERRLVRPGAPRTGDAGLGFRSPRHVHRVHPRLGSARNRPGGARRRGPPRRRLVEAGEPTAGPLAALRVDGGMSDNEVFVKDLADAIGRSVQIPPCLKPPHWGPAYWPASPSAHTARRRRSPTPSHPGEPSSPKLATRNGRSPATAGWPPD